MARRRWWPFRGWRRGSAWQGVDYLDLVPSRAVGFEERPQSGQVVLLVPRYRDAVWGRLIQPRLGPGKRYLKVPLEERGSLLWRAMDGRRQVRDLVALLAEAPDAGTDQQQELARRVCLYLHSLVDNRFVTLARSGEPGVAADSAET